MKKFAAGLLSALCATTFSVAQQYESNEWPQEPASEYTAPAVQEAQPEVQNAVPSEAPADNATNTIAPANNAATNSAPAANETTASVNNDAQAANSDVQTAITYTPKKKASVNVGAGASFIYGRLFGFEGLKNDDMDDPTGFGGDFGVKASFVIIDGLQFAPQIMFRIFNVNHEDEGFTRYYNQTFLDFTFFMRGFISEKFFLEVGPQISINTTNDVKINEDDGFKEKIETTPAEIGINIGAGMFVHKNVSITFNWYMGFNEVFPDVKYYFDDDFLPSDRDKYNWSLINLKGAHTMMFKLGVTYWFL